MIKDIENMNKLLFRQLFFYEVIQSKRLQVASLNLSFEEWEQECKGLVSVIENIEISISFITLHLKGAINLNESIDLYEKIMNDFKIIQSSGLEFNRNEKIEFNSWLTEYKVKQN